MYNNNINNFLTENNNNNNENDDDFNYFNKKFNIIDSKNVKKLFKIKTIFNKMLKISFGEMYLQYCIIIKISSIMKKNIIKNLIKNIIKLSHPNILICFGLMFKNNNKNNNYLIYEYYSEINLIKLKKFYFKKINNKKKIFLIILIIINKLSSVLTFIYSLNSAFLNIHPKNILFDKKILESDFELNNLFYKKNFIENNSIIKIINIGMYQIYNDKKNFNNFNNNNNFFSPEFKNFISNNNKILPENFVLEFWDVFSFGKIILFLLNDENIFINNENNKINNEINNLISNCLNNDYSKRIKFKEIIKITNFLINECQNDLINEKNIINNDNNNNINKNEILLKEYYNDFSYFELKKFYTKNQIIQQLNERKKLENELNKLNIEIKKLKNQTNS